MTSDTSHSPNVPLPLSEPRVPVGWAGGRNRIIAPGVTAVVIAGAIDLSVGAVVGLTDVVRAMPMVYGLGTAVACIGELVVAAEEGYLS